MYRSSRKLFLLTGLLLSAAGAQSLSAAQSDANDGARATVKPGLIKKARITLMKAEGDMAAEIYSIEINYAVPRGKQDRLNLVAVYEPNTGLFWWKLETMGKNRKGSVPPTSRLAFCLMNEKIVGIESTGRQLWIFESGEKYKTFEMGLNDLIGRLEKNLVPGKDKKQSRRIEDKFAEVDLTPVLGRDFFRIKGSAALPISARIASVSGRGSQYKITLEGVNKDKVELTLDDDYKIQAATLNGARVAPH